MKYSKFIFCILFLLLAGANVFSALPSAAYAPPAEIGTTESSKHFIQEQLKLAKMKWFASLSVADYEKYSGNKLGFFGKIAFKLNQRQVNRKLQRYDYDDPTTLTKISWFVKGLILGPIAVLLAYIFLPGATELIKWAWFGFAGFAIIVGIILLTL